MLKFFERSKPEQQLEKGEIRKGGISLFNVFRRPCFDGDGALGEA